MTAKVGAVGQWLTPVSTLQIKYEWDQIRWASLSLWGGLSVKREPTVLGL